MKYSVMKDSSLAALAAFFLLISVSSCRKELGPTDLRIKNVSDYDLTNVEVNTSEGIQNYGTITVGQSTDYKRFDKAYRQAQIELYIENEKYTFIPVAYTYEVPLGQGKFTYELSADTTKKELTIHVTADAPLD
ncbi:MAG: hypothetical protein QNK30_12525 [Bacteroidales bacterium]|nr:hypothetical protein [Bacteroidales bacterium]